MKKEAKIEQVIFQNIPTAVLFFDLKKRLLFFNKKAKSLLSLNKKNVIYTSPSKLEKYSKLKPIFDFLGKKISKKEIIINRDIIAQVSTYPVKKVGTLVVLEDITQERLMEIMKSESILVTAHQLRTPLSAIKWTLRLLLNEEIGKLNKEQKEILQKTYRSNEKMIKLIDDILSLSKLEEKRTWKFEKKEIKPILLQVIENFSEQIKKKKLKFVFKSPKEKLPFVKVDVEKIQTVFQNFLDNAIRYTPSGGEVKVILKKENNGVKVAVSDTGIGIPQNQQNKVFTRFFRATNAIRQEIEGSGLGLYTAKKIVESHSGKVGFTSKEGKGSTFWFFLPGLGKRKKKS